MLLILIYCSSIVNNYETGIAWANLYTLFNIIIIKEIHILMTFMLYFLWIKKKNRLKYIFKEITIVLYLKNNYSII